MTIPSQKRKDNITKTLQSIKEDDLNRSIYTLSPITQLTAAELDIENRIPFCNIYADPNDCPTFKNKSVSLQYGIQPYVSYNYGQSTFTNTAEPNNVPQYRSDSERPFFSFDYGVLLSATTKNGFGIFGGINRSVLQEELNYTQQKDTLLLIEDYIKSIVIDARGDSMVTFVDTLINTQYIETSKTYNTYKSIDLPIGIDYHKRMGNVSIGLSVSALINLSFVSEGQAYSDSGVISNFNIEDAYESKIGVRFNFGVPIQYQLRRKLSVGLSPMITYYTEPISSSSYDTSHELRLYSLRLFTNFTF